MLGCQEPPLIRCSEVRRTASEVMLLDIKENNAVRRKACCLVRIQARHSVRFACARGSPFLRKRLLQLSCYSLFFLCSFSYTVSSYFFQHLPSFPVSSNIFLYLYSCFNIFQYHSSSYFFPFIPVLPANILDR